ncbi:MAG: CsgG/HfaB family protein, partial [Synergistaceae bacterium]|nr:CsgG/HfaB family protein [Synergistaceae bacterium]
MKSHGKVLSMLFAAVVIALSALGISEASDGRIGIGIATFESKVNEVEDMQAAIITDIFSNTLYNSKRIRLVERERINDILDEILEGDTGFYDPETVAEIGRLAGVQYLILGSVTELNKKASGGGIPIPILWGGAVGSGKMEAMAKLSMRVVEVETGEVILSLSEVGRSANSSTAVSFAGVTWAEGEFGGIEARAIGDAALRLSHKIRERIADDYSYVIEAGDKEFMIDEGETRAVEPGMLFLVYGEGKTLLDREGNPIARKRIPLAVLKVARTDFDMSYCNAASGTKGNVIRRGDRIEPIGSEEASKMVKDKVFPAKRPDGLSGRLADEILPRLGGGDNAGSSPAGKQTIVDERETPEPEPELEQEPAQRTPVTVPTPVQEPARSTPAVAPPASREGVDPNTSESVDV